MRSARSFARVLDSIRARSSRLRAAASMAARRAWAEQLEERRLLSAMMLTSVLSTNSSNPSAIVSVNGEGYLATTDSTGTYTLWKTDGTPAGTSVVTQYLRDGPTDLTASN